MRSLLPALALLLSLGAAPALAQALAGPQLPVLTSHPAAAPADVASVESIVAALYESISGPAGQPRDWDRLRSLFVPRGRLIPTAPRAEGGVGLRLLEVNDYIAGSGPRIEAMGFREREIARRVERFGHLAHVLSTYEGRSEDGSVNVRGINSIQLMNDGTRWWVVSLYWEAESPGNPLPAHYLPGS